MLFKQLNTFHCLLNVFVLKIYTKNLVKFKDKKIIKLTLFSKGDLSVFVQVFNTNIIFYLNFDVIVCHLIVLFNPCESARFLAII